MDEIFKTIDEFENYEISNIGNVRNKKSERILKSNLRNGYFAEKIIQVGLKMFRFIKP